MYRSVAAKSEWSEISKSLTEQQNRLGCILWSLLHHVSNVINSIRRKYITDQRERGQWTVYYTSPQSFIITFDLITLGLLLNLYFWLILLSVQTFQTLILIYIRGNFVYHHCMYLNIAFLQRSKGIRQLPTNWYYYETFVTCLTNSLCKCFLQIAKKERNKRKF